MATKPATKQLNSKQKEILARKLGYDGPMNMFEEFIKSDPAMSAKYSTVVEKFMARGGMAKKYAKGGVLKMAQGGAPTPPQYPLTYENEGKQVPIDPNVWENRLKSSSWANSSTGVKVQQAINRVGGVDKAKALVANYKIKEREYGINQYKYQLNTLQATYDQDPTTWNLLQLSQAYNNAINYFDRVDPSQKGTYEKLASEYTKKYDDALRAQEESEALKQKQEADAAALRTTAYDTRQRLYEEASTRQKTELDRLLAERDSLLTNIDTQYKTDIEQLDSAFSAKQIDKATYDTLRSQVSNARTTARNAAQTNYSTAAANVRTQKETDFGFASQTYEDLLSGKTPTTQQFNLPTFESPNITTGTQYTPINIPPPTAALPSTTQQQPAATTPAAATTTAPATLMGATPTMTGTPVAKPDVPQVQARGVPLTQEQLVSAQGAPAQAATVQPNVVGQVATAAGVAPKEAATMEAATATPGVATALEGVQPVTGTVSPEAQVQAQTMQPTETAVSQLQAATGEATMVQPPPARTVQEGELVAGPTVDMGRVEETLAQAQAAQGEVTPEMTVQYQIQQLTEGFDATNPPPWAAGAIRNVNSVLVQRGLGASSLAGQAVVQAALESALPIAAADAKVYQDMGIQNLSNRQQMAVLTAQQRAAFLGQEFDQAFQTRVTNAATISEIANINFTAEQQIALENARLTNTVNLANLSNQQALVMAEAAQIANLETANLNNRQQAAVLNAQAFLQMDMANLANEQQTELFKAQSMVNSLLTDAAAENAARQFNASSINQVNQFYDGLTAQIQQFNAAQTNGINQFNVSQINAVAEFNASSQNARDQFNAEYRRIIDQSNVEWRRNIALADTAAVNRANEINAANALGITTIDYNNTWQQYRDSLEMAWKTSEGAMDREVQLALGVLSKQAAIESAKFAVEAEKAKALGALAAVGLDKSGLLAAGGAAVVSALSGGKTGTVGTGGVTGPDFMDFVNSTGTWGLKESVDGFDTYFNGTDTLEIDNMTEQYYWNGNLIWEPNMPEYGGETYPDGTFSGVE
jgi:hypothetical protein